MLNRYPDYVNTLKKLVDDSLHIYFDNKLEEVGQIDKSAMEICKFTKGFTLQGGKRLRSIFMLLMYQGYTGKDELDKEVIQLSLIWELYQSFLLIHDDIIDQDDVRRGGDSMHIALEKHLSSKHQGLSHAILNGDILFLWAEEIIIKNTDNPSELLKLLIHEISKVIYGEIIDVLPWRKIKDVVELEQRIKKIHDLKTVSYTTRGPILAAAILANIKGEEFKLLEELSENLGLAFQAKDDYLGVYGNPDKTGKSILSDLKEGKLTYLVSSTLRNSTKEESEKFMKLLGDENLTDEQFEDIQKLFIDNGSKEYCEQMIETYSKNSLNILEKLNIRDKEKNIIRDTIKRLVDREV